VRSHWPALSTEGGAVVIHAGMVAAGEGPATAAVHTGSSRALRTPWRDQAAMPRLTTACVSSCSLIKTVPLHLRSVKYSATLNSPPTHDLVQEHNASVRVCTALLLASCLPSACEQSDSGHAAGVLVHTNVARKWRRERWIGTAGAEMRGNAD
jgi:hypothetical protein